MTSERRPMIYGHAQVYLARLNRVMHTFDDAGWQPECYL